MSDGKDLRIGVLGLQGDFRNHIEVLSRLGVETAIVRRPADLEGIDGLVLPGGESTAIAKLATEFGLTGPLRAAIDAGLPTWGTCAGMILLAERLLDGVEGQETIGGLDVTVRRNAFGSQLDSFHATLDFDGRAVPAVFIRAPLIEDQGDGVRTLAALDDGRVIAVRSGDVMATSFHPEMTGDTYVYEYFLAMAAAASTTRV